MGWAEAQNPTPDWPTRDPRRVVRSDWMWAWREGCEVVGRAEWSAAWSSRATPALRSARPQGAHHLVLLARDPAPYRVFAGLAAWFTPPATGSWVGRSPGPIPGLGRAVPTVEGGPSREDGRAGFPWLLGARGGGAAAGRALRGWDPGLWR